MPQYRMYPTRRPGRALFLAVHGTGRIRDRYVRDAGPMIRPARTGYNSTTDIKELADIHRGPGS